MNEQQFEVAIIDGDSIAWIIGYNNRDNVLEGMVIESVDSFVRSIVSAVGATYIIGYLGNSSKTSIRRDLVETYKSNRPDTPEWYKQWAPIIEDRLISKWNFIRSVDGYEADDMIAAAAAQLTDSWVICGVDKDLKQIPGNHFNYNKQIFSHVTLEEGKRSLAIQLLMGDSTDGIKGIPKVGPKTAEKILDTIPSDVSLLIGCLNEYLRVFGEDQGPKQFYQNFMQVKLHTDIPDFEVTKYDAAGSDSVIPAPTARVEPMKTKAAEDDTQYDMTDLFKVAS